MGLETKVKCPHCGVSVLAFLDEQQLGKGNPIVVSCCAFKDDDEECENDIGCGEDFVVYPTLIIKATTKKIA